MIDPDFWLDEEIGQLSRDTRLFYIALWNYSDDYGKQKYSPMRLKAEIFPYDNDISINDIEDSVNKLQAINKVKIYLVNGNSYLYLSNFNKHQKINRPTESRLPDFSDKFIEDSVSPQAQKKLREVKLREVKLNKERQEERQAISELLTKPVDNSVDNSKHPALQDFVCPFKKPTDKDKTMVANIVKQKLKQKTLGSKELKAYLTATWKMCYFVKMRWNYSGCDKEKFNNCRTFFEVCLVDLQEAANKKQVTGWKPAYLQGIVEKTINEEGGAIFK